MMRKAIYAGSFDPLTNGHLWMIREGLELFDELVVAIGENPNKKYHLSLKERIWMLKEELYTVQYQKDPRMSEDIQVTEFSSKYLVNFAKHNKCSHIIRGIRNPADFQYESIIKEINHSLDPTIKTIFLMPPKELAEVSSSIVKGLIGPEGWEDVIKKYVPETVYNQLIESYG